MLTLAETARSNMGPIKAFTPPGDQVGVGRDGSSGDAPPLALSTLQEKEARYFHVAAFCAVSCHAILKSGLKKASKNGKSTGEGEGEEHEKTKRGFFVVVVIFRFGCLSI